MSGDEIEELDFEEAFARLEQVVQTLERGGLTLARATSLYEEGMRLAQVCGRRLDAAELKVTELQNAFLNQVNGQEPEDG